MSKKRLKIPLAVQWMSPAECKQHLSKRIPKSGGDFAVIYDGSREVPLLIAATESALRILVMPEIEGKDRKKAKGCCDKRCSKCQIPLRSSSTIGYFVERRIRKAMKKEKWCRSFRGKQLTSALEELSIQTYSPAPGHEAQQKLHRLLAFS